MKKSTKHPRTKPFATGDEIFSSILQMAHDAIIVIDENQNILFFNQGAEQIFGYNASEIIGQQLEILLPPHVTDLHRIYVRSFDKAPFMARLMGERKEILGRRKNGVIFPAEASIAKVSSAGKTFFTAILRDITERKIAEQALRESEKKLSRVLNGVDEIIYQVNYPQGDSAVNGWVEFVSERTQEMLGYRSTDFIADPNRWFSLIHPEDVPTVQAQTTKIFTSGQPGLRHYRIKDINGEYRWMEDRVSLEKDKTGQVVRTFGVARDITERKQADEALRSQETRFRALIENGSDGIMIVDEKGVMTYSSPSILRIFGYTMKEIVGRNAFELIHPEDLGFSLERFENLLAKPGSSETIQFRFQHQDGGWRWLEATGVNMFNETAVRGIVVNFRDITERKQAEEALRQSEEIYRTLVEQASDGIFIADAEGNYTEVNSRACEMLGYTRAEILQLKISDLLDPSELERTPLRLDELRQGKSLLTERTFIRKDKSIFPAEISAKMLPGGQLQAIVRDITERKRAEEQLHDSEERFRATFEQAAVGIAHVGTDGSWLRVNQRLCDIIGYTRDELSGLTFQDITHSDDLQTDLNYVHQILADEIKAYSMEKRYIRKDRSILWINLTVSLVRETSGEPKYFISVVEDITERKHAEAERLQLLNVLESSLNEIYIFDAENLRFQYVNQGALRNLGYTREAMSAMSPLDIKPEFNQDSFRRLVEPLLRLEQEKLIFHTVHRRADGSLYPVEVHLQLSDFEGKRVFYAIILDITERKQVEKGLQESETRYRSLIENSHDLIQSVAPDGSFLFVNEAWHKTLGYSAEEIVRLNVFDIIHPDSLPHCEELFAQSISGIAVPNVEVIFVAKDGRSVITEGNVSPRWLDNQVVATQAFFRDITERKRTGEEIAKLSNAVEQSGDIIFITDRNGMIEYVNPAFETVTGYGKEESLGKSPNIISSGLMEVDDYERIWKTILSGEVFRGEIIDRKKGGEIFYYDQTITPLKDERGNITHFVSTGKDVTERKQAEEQIRQRLSELEVLYESGLAISQLLKPIEIAQKIIGLLDRKLDWHHTTIRLYHPQDETLELLAFNQPGMRSEQEKRAVEERFKTSIAKKGQGLSGWVIEHGQSVRTSNLINDARYVETFPGLHSGLYVPIIIGEHTIGVISIESEAENAFSEADERLATTLAAQAASALENARLFEETERRLKRLQSLHAIDKAITGSMDIGLILDVIIGQVISQLNADATVILLYDQTAKALKYAKGSGFRTEALQHTCLPLGEGHAGRVALGRQLVQIPDLQTRRTDFLRSPTFSQEGFVSYFGVPLIANDEIKGVMEVFHRAAFEAETDWLNFLEALAVQTAIAIDNATLFKGLQLSNVELSMAYDATIAGWSHAMDLKDKETQDHTRRVTEMTERLARAMGIGDADLVHIRRGALLHDIGKMGVPDSILLKPAKLTDEEWALMRQHPQFAYNMLSPIAYLRPAMDIPYCHHEKWDGTGYPRGLKGEQIPFAARIFAMVDVWDALTSDRPYREGWSKEKTLEYIREQSGKHFDPQVVEAFLQMVEEGRVP